MRFVHAGTSEAIGPTPCRKAICSVLPRQAGEHRRRRTGQPWDFVIVTDPERLQQLSTVWQGARHIASAPAAIALIAPVPPDERRKLLDQYDLGQATMAMMLAATELGVGTGHSSVGDQDKARAILGVPDDHIVAYLLGLGYPADRPLAPINKPNRRPFDEVVHRGKW